MSIAEKRHLEEEAASAQQTAASSLRAAQTMQPKLENEAGESQAGAAKIHAELKLVTESASAIRGGA
eukprot:4626048-Pyramimonas_sp.AAC.1